MTILETSLEIDRATELASLRRLAEGVLPAYGLAEARLRLMEHKKNTTFRVDEPAPSDVPLRQRRYVLRICEVGGGGYGEAEIRSELQYLEALAHATGLVVPEPVRSEGGSLVVSGKAEGLSEPRYCALFRWVPGRMVRDDPTPERLLKVGMLLARIHCFSQTFEPPGGFSRPRWDARGLFGEGPVLALGQGEPLVSDRGRELLEEAARIVRGEMDELGEGREVFGIVHKDLEPDNTVVDGEEVHAIDFADLGWGYYLYDIASSLLPLKEKRGFSEMEEAFLRGYQQVRPLAPEHTAKLETFYIARSVFASRLMLGKLWELTQIRDYAGTAIPQILGGVRRFLDQRCGGGRGVTRTTVQFLSHLRSLEVKLWAEEGDKLRFKAPRGVMSPELLGELKDRKAEILGFLRHGAQVSAAPIPRAGRERVPLSFAQQRLWFIDQLLPGSPVYNIARSLRLEGLVRVETLWQSLNAIVDRHESLRTTFAVVVEEPIQAVSPRLDLAMPVVDLTGLPREAREPEAWRLALGEARLPFDLERGPLLRVCLMRLEGTLHIAPSTMHHIVGDGWSSSILFREMGAIYMAYAEGRPSPLEDLLIQYPDFAQWQRQWLTGEVLEDQLSFWAEQLRDAPQRLELPTDRPRGALRSPRSTREAMLIPRRLTEELRAFAQARGATLFMILLAVFKTLLHRYSGQDDLCVGSPIANRNRIEIEGLIGFFANTLVVRTRLDGQTRFRDLLEKVRQTTLGAYAHQDLPFERIVEELQPDRSVGETPFFQVVFTLQNVPYPDMQVRDFRMSLMPPTSRVTPFDLNLNMKEMPEGVRTSWNYKQDLFDATTILRLAGHYRRLLEAVVEDPDLELGELAMLRKAEHQQVLKEWNDSTSVLPRATLDELFENWVSSSPRAPAVVAGEEVWDYRQLGRRVRALAHRLVEQGVKPGSLVGISIERSPELVAAMVAIVKAGGAYVPLDPDYPDERLDFMVDETEPPVVLVSPTTQARFEELLRRRVEGGRKRPALLRVDVGFWGRSEEGVEAVSRRGGPSSTAYVVYTSGSTGRPKGVVVPQQAVVRLVRSTDYIRLNPEDRVAHLSNTSFDAATFEIWGPLLNGAAVVVIDREVALSPKGLVKALRRWEVSTLFLTTALFNQLAREVPDAFRSLHHVAFGGEAVDPRAVRAVLADHPPRRLLHMYGPTEATTFATWHRVEQVPPDAVTVPIGGPTANTTSRVLGADLNPVPIGVAGELYLGGPGLACGYWKRPALTAERFVPHPGGEKPGERLYRTGDRVRWGPGGAVEFLGRVDGQVKLRGFRVELGEIAVALEGLSEVAAAVVEIREPQPGDRRLVAYVVPAKGSAPSVGELKSLLRHRLPEFMIPAAVLLLDALPLTPNGKVDRAALPAPDRGQTTETAGTAEPRTPAEELIAGIWAEVLGLERVGRDEDFFDLGGHSLLATQVVSRLRDVFALELPLQRLFEATTVSELARVVEEAGQEGDPEQVRLEALPRHGDLPLSFAQQRLWFLDQLEPGGSTYNVFAGLRLTGRLEAGRLEQVFTEVVRRHEALRTHFPEHDGEPCQVIRSAAPVTLQRVDLSALPEAIRRVEIRRLADAESRRPFDLATGPLARFAVLRLDGAEHALLVTLHHIVSDGWSTGVLMGEVAALYRTFEAGAPSPLPELSVQYADYARWQRRWLADGVLEAELVYWRQRLEGAPAVLGLPTDRPRPPVETFRGRSRPLTLPRELSDQAGTLARREGVTLFMLLLAVFDLLLYRWSGQRDVVVGSPIAGRHRREIEGLIGFFVNTLVLRTDLSGDPALRELLRRVRQVTLGAYAHQHLPFERLVEELSPQRELSHSPLFQVMLVLQNAPLGELELADLTFSRLEAGGGTSMFDLTLSLSQGVESLGGTLTYNTDLFDATTIGRFASHLEQLLRAAVAQPDRRLSELSWWTVAQRHQLLREFNDTGAPAIEACLHELFEAQVERSPESEALVCGDQRWTYRELDRRANRLAHRLRSAGVGPEDRVGLCLRRTADLVAAMLAVLKAGGAYVPLDPSYPRERLAFTLEDAAVKVVLAEAQTQEALPETPVPVLPAATDGGREERPLPSAVPANLAYLIYTSGSTGRPKGVAIEHRAAAALVGWARRDFRRDELAGVMASTSISFDLSVFEIFVPLACGGRVILADDALRLPLLPAASEVRLVNTVPSAMAELVRMGGLPPSVRTVNLAGEPLTRALVEEIYRGSGVERVCNLYGPSEDTTYSTWVQVDAGEREPTIGRPLAGTRVYVLDPSMDPIPPGVVGELYLAGAGLARGYLARPARTAAAWLPDPFGGSGQRLYRTGDRVRFRADGELEFLGRLDHQVKVRGFRIELGEIEAALALESGVREVVVVARREQAGARLVAYLALEGSPRPRVEELRQSLARVLPEHMIPSLFVVLTALPRTPNGKVDRKALPAPEPALAAAPEAPYVAPRSPEEELMAGIWTEVLGLERVGREQSFFHVGGHSLLATRVVSRVRRVFQVELPLQQLFEEPTIAGLTRAVRVARAEGSVSRPRVTAVARGGELPLSFAQQRLWFFDQIEPGSAAYNLPAAVRIHGPLPPSLVQQTFGEVLRRHEVLRTRFAASGGRPRQLIDPPSPPRLPVVDLSALPSPGRLNEAERLRRWEGRRPFDLAADPPARLTLLRLEERDHLLLETLHHIASDAWSTGVMLRELVALYRAFGDGFPSPLAELTVQYADFALWQRSWLSGAVLESEVEHWRQRLEGAPPMLELPTDQPRPPMSSFRGGVWQVVLRAELVTALAALGRREGATLFMVLLAAFQALLGRWAGQRDVVVGSPVAGRNQQEVEDLVGFFVNTLPLRARLGRGCRFRELLEAVRREALEAYSHQDLPFEHLIEKLALQRELSHNPLVQVMLVLQNAPRASLSAGELDFEPLRALPESAPFDLTLVLEEGEAGHGLRGSLIFSEDLFDATTAGRLLNHYQRMLTAVTEAPDEALEELSLWSPAERHQLLVEWNDRVADAAPEATFLELFAAQVVQRPEAVALVFEDPPGGTTAHLSYRELALRAAILARELRRCGVGPEKLVGLAVERSPEMVIGVLGTLHAGGAYLPLDPSYPTERLAYMAADAGLKVLVTAGGVVAELEAEVERVVRLDEAATFEGDPLAAAGDLLPEHPAYVIYTSGSTGRPKGVTVPHRGWVNVVAAQVAGFGVGAATRVLQFSSLSFDASAFEIAMALGSGATLCLGRREALLPGEPLVRLLARQQVTLVVLPPSALAALPQVELPALSVITSAGEALHQDLVDLWAPGRRLFNLYGPTETTIWATWVRCRPGAGAPSIGRAIPGARVEVLDDDGRPVPLGLVGELTVGGTGLARGYLSRPAKTAGSFIPDPLSGKPGARRYRTGDRGRWRPGGELEFLGRLDHQVKLRGFRIEPGEIEVALERLPGVRQAVVVVWQDPPGDPRLVAYLVPEKGIGVEPQTVRRKLRSSLPEHMVPAVFMILEELPSTPSGKVDRRALPAPDRAPREGSYLAPRDEVELGLVEIWEDLLEVFPVGVRDDFFELGGHSLTAVRLVARIQERFGRDLPLAVLFADATVEHLAAMIARRIEPPRPSPLIPLRHGAGKPLFLVHPLGGHALCYVDLARALPPGRPVWGVQVPEGHQTSSVQEIAVRYASAIRESCSEERCFLGGWSAGGLLALETARRLQSAGTGVDLLVLLDPTPPESLRILPRDDGARLDLFARELAGLQGMGGRLAEKASWHGDEDPLRCLYDWARTEHLVPPELELSRLQQLFGTFSGNLRALSSYVPEPFEVRTELFQTVAGNDSAKSWRKLVGGGLVCHEVPGDHFTMLRHPLARDLARRLGERLEDCTRGDEGRGS